MKILHVTQGLVNVSGVDNLVYELCINALKQGECVEVCALSSLYLDKKCDFEKAGIKVYVSPYIKNYDPRHIVTLIKLFERFDVVHIHLFPNQFYSSIAKCLICSYKRPIIVTTEHSTFNHRRDYRLLRSLDRWMYRQYSHIFSISYAVQDALKQWGMCESDRMSVIENGINIKKFSNALNTLHKYIDLNPTKKYVVMVAKLAAPKDQTTLIKAIALFKGEVDLILVGDGPDMNKLKQLSIEVGIAQHVHFLGACNDVAGVIKGCHIGVLSSHYEGFGLVAAEYMAAGIPVIASDVSGLRHVIGENRKDLLFVPGDYKILAEKLNKILNDPRYYDELVTYGVKRVQDFSSEKMSQKYLNTYYELITNK